MGLQASDRLAVAMGGFLIFLGIIMMGIFVLVLLGFIDASLLDRVSENSAYRTLSLCALLVIGGLDLLSGIILRRE